MKKKLLYLIPVFLLSCTGPSDEYEKLIAQYAQTDKKGIFTDCQFEAVEIKELAAITVDDSTRILKAEFTKNKGELISSITSRIKYAETNLNKEEKNRYKFSQVIDTYKKRINIEKARLDSVENSVFVNPYQNDASDKILLQPVKCRYYYVFPAGHPKQERTDIFYFTSDLQKIVQQVKQK